MLDIEEQKDYESQEEEKLFKGNHLNHDHALERKDDTKKQNKLENQPKADGVHIHNHDHHGHQHKMVSNNDSAVTAYILLLAMGIHGFFAGLTFGVESGSEIFPILIALLAHKWCEALTIGISFVNAKIQCR